MAVALRAVAKSLPTMQRAARLFDAVVERLADRGFLDPSFAMFECERHLYLSDAVRPSWFAATSFLEHRFVNRGELVVVGLDAPTAPPTTPPDPDIVPTGPFMRAGKVVLREGPAYVSVEYSDRGLRSSGVHAGGDTFLFGYRPDSSPFVVAPLARPPTLAPHSTLCRQDVPAGPWTRSPTW